MKRVVKTVFFLVSIYMVLSTLIGLYRAQSGEKGECRDRFEENPLSHDRLHHRSWRLINESQYFCIRYETEDSRQQELATSRTDLQLSTEDYAHYWQAVYGQLVRQNWPYVKHLRDSLFAQGQLLGLDRLRLAEMVVTFVQDIPYSFIMPDDCESVAGQNSPCVANARFGILSPYEFMHSLHGDCDTRAVLLYALLGQMGFKPIIVGSDKYLHAMLALNLPASGDHLEYRGERYYFWETTAKDWRLGMLAPEMNNVQYWEVSLGYEILESLSEPST